jgi:hypothetical protein
MAYSRLIIISVAVSFSLSAYAANPFLNTPDDRPVSAEFGGTEWSDDIGEQEIPLSATVVTTRIGKMPWGAIFKVEFNHLESPAEKVREIRPDYFITTDSRIVLLNEEDNEAAAKRISTLEKPPNFDPTDIYGIASGSFANEEGEWKTTIRLKGDLCLYEATHPSGHFRKIVWKKGVGLVEYASGYGAHADGCRLKRVAAKEKQ